MAKRRTRRRSNAWFQKLLEKGSETTYRRTPSKEHGFRRHAGGARRLYPDELPKRTRTEKEPEPEPEPVRYKGYVIRPMGEEWEAEDSRFESLAEAKRFLDHPLQKANPASEDDIKRLASTYAESLRRHPEGRRKAKAVLRRLRKELDEHRAWLRSKGYEDDGVAHKLENNIRFQELALQMSENPRGGGPPIRSTAKAALHLYDQGVRTAYDWTAGLPSRLGHSLLSNPEPGELAESYEEHLGLTTSPEFIEADPEEQAGMMTGMDMAEEGMHEHCGCEHSNPVTYMLTVGKQMSLTPPHPAENFNLQGPFKFIPKYTPVRVQERGRGGHRFLVHGEYYSSPFWGWVEKDELAKWDPGDPDLRNNPKTKLDLILDRVVAGEHEVTFDVRDYTEEQKQKIIDAAEDRGLNAASDGKHILVRDLRNNPKRTSGRYLPPGTRVIINDNMRINAAATIVKWGQSRDQYGAPETALVKMERTGSLQEVPLWAIQPAEGDFPKGSSYRPNPDSIFDYEDAQREGRRDGHRHGVPGISTKMVNDYFRIWWYYQGKDLAKPSDKQGNNKAYRKAFMQAVKERSSTNPRRNPQSAADQMYETFHGKPPDTDVIVEEQIHEHEHLATLGPLVSLKVETRSGYLVELGWEAGKDFAPYLACNEQGNQLYIEGGDQSIDLDSFKMGGKEWKKDLIVIGDLVETTYQTQKDFDNFETIDYFHHNGEESGEVPQLLYDPNSKADKDSKKGKMYIAGGKYRIEHDGIID